ncbi:hypothetical protein [Terrabacter terrigena]|uniref:Uncharacterized protein n=1 Tax=Terrabacter terrigena TaxID=574718 RepID=A0ABW3N0G5_9MICO
MAVELPASRVILSGVRSVTHLVYAASWLRHHVERADGAVQVVVLDVGSGFGHARVGEAEVRSYLPDHPRLHVETLVRDDHWRVPTDVDLTLLSIGLPGTRAWARLVVAGRGRRPRVVVVDEGIGSFGNLRSRRDAYRRQGGSAVRTLLRAGVVSAAGTVLTDVHWSLYEPAGDRWVVRDDVAAEFRHRLSGSSPSSTRGVYLTQPWPDIGVMSEASYLEHLVAVRDQCAAAGIGLALRPHPSENLERYAGFEVVLGAAPAELAREVVGSRVVIGSNSTALLNLAAVHGTPALRVTAPELTPLETALTRRQRSLLDTFLPTPVPVGALSDRIRSLPAGV